MQKTELARENALRICRRPLHSFQLESSDPLSLERCRVALKFAAREIRRQHSSPFFLRSRHISEKEAAAAAPHHARKLPPPSLPPSLPHGLASPQSEIPSPFAGFQPRAPFLLFAFILAEWEGVSLWSEVERKSARNSIPGGAKVFLQRASERARDLMGELQLRRRRR